MKKDLTSLEGGLPDEKFLSLPCPPAGTGVHQWLAQVSARHIIEYGPDLLRELIKKESERCGRDIPTEELESAIAFAIRVRMPKWGSVPQGSIKRKPLWSEVKAKPFNPEMAKARVKEIKERITRGWLQERSPLPVSLNPDQILKEIFAETEKTLVFDQKKSQGRLWPQNLVTQWPTSAPEGLWYLINPVDGEWHKNRAGKSSRRSEENTTAYHYAVVESDLWKDEEEVWLSLLVQMVLPIVMITHSGDRGAHALVRVGAKTKDEWERFKAHRLLPLVELGADPSNLSAVRLSRVPNVWREETQQNQELLYLAPRNIQRIYDHK